MMERMDKNVVIIYYVKSVIHIHIVMRDVINIFPETQTQSHDNLSFNDGQTGRAGLQPHIYIFLRLFVCFAPIQNQRPSLLILHTQYVLQIWILLFIIYILFI